jgi:hypothetical protein
MTEISPIPKLMVSRLGRIYEKYRNTHDRDKILMGKLKSVLSGEIETLLRLNGLTNPPFDPFRISRIGKVPVRVEFMDAVGSHGTLEVSGDEFLIRLDKSLSHGRDDIRTNYRLRSTMAHELMHTFFYDTSEIPPKKIGHDSPSRRDLLMQEELCYFLARQLLMPSFSVKVQIASRNYLKSPSIKSVHSLKSIYVVSSDLVAYRFIKDLNIWNAIFMKFAKTNGGYRSVTKLRAKPEKSFDFFKIPQTIPPRSSDEWYDLLSDHILRTVKKKRIKENVLVRNQRIVLDSSLDSKDPASVITIVCDAEADAIDLDSFL